MVLRDHEHRQSASCEQLARDAPEVQVRVRGAADNEEVGAAVQRQALELGGHLAVAAGEATADPGSGELLSDSAAELVAVLGANWGISVIDSGEFP